MPQDAPITPENQLRQRIRELEEQLTRNEAAVKALAESEERFAIAVSGSNDGIWDWNVVTGDVYYSPRFKELLGYEDDEFSNQFTEWEACLHPDDREPTLVAIRAHLHENVPYDVEYRLLCKTGAWRWFRAKGKALRNAQGVAYRMAGSITDISDRKEALRALAKSEERFSLAVQGANDGIWDWDVRSNEVYYSPRWKSMLGYAPHELADTFATFENLLHPDDRPRVLETVKQYLAQGLEHYSVEFRARHADGAYRWILARGIALFDASGRPYRMSGSHTDITPQKESLAALARSEEQLILAKQAAEMANRAKSEFLANMSHEIRTPMNGILGLTELLLNMELSPEQRSYETLVRQSAESLLTILNDILDFSKIEAGKLELEEMEFRIRDAIGDTLQSLGVRAAEKGLELACHIGLDVPEAVVGDLSRLRQVLINLVGNAIKFTIEGEVVVEVLLESATSSHVTLHFLVRDTGIGIPEDKHDAIFEAFTQAESSTTRRFGGTGLGLTICRQLVDLMQGRIWVESTPGVGSTFHFTGIFATAPLSNAPTSVPDSLRQMHVLVVDDNGTNRKILEEMLKGWAMTPVLAASGAEALAILEGWAGPAFNLMLLDVMMPEMDGPQVAQRVRDRFGEAAPKVLILSSAGHVIQLARATHPRTERVLTKPVKQSDLLDAILRLFCAEPVAYVASAVEHPVLPDKPMRPLRLLLAEDGRVNQLVAMKLLQDRGHSVALVNNGQEALDLLSAETFDAVLMDIQMPVLNGYETTEKIRQWERERGHGAHLPIIAMTANAMKGDRERCLAAGMDGYVAKPVRSAELFRAVEGCASAAPGPVTAAAREPA
ncbi:MAG: PAS domain-containing protein, partial [Roseimicrobium sp.]